MKKNNFIFLFALFPLIPVTSRFAYGIILCFALIWLFLSGILFQKLIGLIYPEDKSFSLELVCLGGSATLFFLMLQGLFPILSISLRLTIFLSSFSFILVTSIMRFSSTDVSFLPLVPYLPLLLVFSAFREILGLGSISFPLPSGLLEISVLPYFELYGLGFWSTSGGALILTGILAWFIKFIDRKLSISRRNS